MQNTKVLRLGGSESFACNARHKGFMALSFRSLRMQGKAQGFQGFALLNCKKAKTKLKASSKEAQRKLEGIMKQAKSRFEASCEESNRNSRKLTGSLKEASRKHKASSRKLQESLREF